MFLKAIPAVSMPSVQTSLSNSVNFSSSLAPSLNCSYSFPGFVLTKKRDNGVVMRASREAVSVPLTGVVFQPFEEVKKDELMIPVSPGDSLARQRYSEDCEAAINEQIK
ncbi:Ferroxidase [Handroanthus impetiginosus]|uniref:Ferroxidase n=1 Tax=Handroanthus impetiginosus TaxID=429701 RepID=A0A2G9GC76_9LAMI|nr:Ferroxidase [Handroanthus impetiginosus]